MFSEQLFALSGRGVQTFEAMKRHDAKLGYPHRQFKSIHVAGTNGKGSVSTKIAAVLQNLGYKVGLYTSPHIAVFHERIRINGEMIPEKTAEELLACVFDPTLSFFDVLTALAFVYFAREKVDFGVIEVGLGGRLDATNVIEPILSIITSIGHDHTALLGTTLAEIAHEKGGIIKKGVPLIVGASAVPFFPTAIHVKEEPFYELENQCIARRALRELGIWSEKGLEVRPPCRFQQIGHILFDVAHNPPAFSRLVEALQYHYPNRKFPFYLAFSLDKDWKKCVEIVKPYATDISFISSATPRLRQEYPGFKMVLPSEIQAGVVAGSFYIMEEVQRRNLKTSSFPSSI
ncbi:MAG TPA: Mur ligase family protein [Chlamydiales bacterium]|nr:Mur ligase family protein [Chlamydiales bacterium]